MKMIGATSGISSMERQLGATAVEFALLFPLLFAVLYGTIVYGYAFFIQQQINFAAEQGARAAVAFVNTNGTPTSSSARCLAATPAVAVALASMSATEHSFLSAATCNELQVVNPPPALPASVRELSVTLTFNFLGMLPAINLPGIGNIPVLPSPLTATATVLE